jgi:hypothetical protein
MEVPLRKAPDIYFDPQMWKLFQSYFEPPELAIERISGLPEVPGCWYHRETDTNLPNEEEQRFQMIEEARALGKALLVTLRGRLLNGQISATGIKSGYNSDKRVEIPPERWLRLWPYFITNSAMAQLDLRDPLPHRYHDIRLSSNDASLARAIMLEDCISFLKQRQDAGVEQRKVLIAEASGFFDPPVPTRIFNEAYQIVFKKSRGHPRLKKK